LVKSRNLMPLSSSSLKKLNSCFIFSQWGALAVRANSEQTYRDRRRTATW
jgi:hypothetical protein